MRRIILEIPTPTPDEEVLQIFEDLDVCVGLGLYKSVRLEADDPAEITEVLAEMRTKLDAGTAEGM